MNDALRSELRAGLRQGVLMAAVALVVAAPLVIGWRALNRPAVAPASVPAATLPAAPPREVDFAGAQPPDDVLRVAAWSVATADHGPAPFAIIDKQRTHLYVFDNAGRLRGHTPVLLGYAPGDDTVPGIGQRPIEQVRPHERTTPAGRFSAQPGRNLLPEDVVWVDYDAAVSMHRVRVTSSTRHERRLERLASPTTADNRISYGCINVPAEFFDTVVWPALGASPTVVYVLPEVKSLEQVFPQAALWRPASRVAGREGPSV